MNEQGIHIKVPLKWHKYLLLVQYDLTTIERLRSEVRRFAWSEYDRLVEHLRESLPCNPPSAPEWLFIVKPVDPDAVGNLPNCRLVCQRDLDRLDVSMRGWTGGRYTELWVCCTRIDPSILSVAGRILFRDEAANAQVFEQVWRCSPRLIEEFTSGKESEFAWPYCRAVRSGWGWPYTIEEAYCPSGTPDTLARMSAELPITMELVERQRERIEIFLEKVLFAGISNVCLEYKVVGNVLWFVDWDTPDDRRVLRVFMNHLRVAPGA